MRQPNNKPEIDLSKAFAEAWKGFKGWWIPLCLVSSILFLTKWLPEFVIHAFSEATVIESYKEEVETFQRKVEAGYDPVNATHDLMFNIITLNESAETKALLKKILIFFIILFLVVCVLHVIIIVMSKFSVSKEKGRIRDYSGKPLLLTPSYIFLTLIKFVPFMLFVIPGIYFYVKLYFTGFIITEKSANPFQAMKKSWQLTRGIFWPTFTIFIMTLIIDFISLITIIGFIPGTSFKYTLRASLYKQALELYKEKSQLQNVKHQA